MAWLVTIALVCLLVAGPACATANRDAVAVIIGNRDYHEPVPDVAYAHNDAAAMAAMVTGLLGYRRENVLEVRDGSLVDLYRMFGSASAPEGELFYTLRPGRSDVLVYYSGHGVPGRDTRRGFLLPVNGHPDLAEATGYPIDLLYDNLAKLPARSVTVFLDTCFSGTSDAGSLVQGVSANFGVRVNLPAPGPRLTVLTATGPGETASWDRTAKHGMFTEYLLRGLYGGADADRNGQVTVAEVKALLDDQMSYRVRRRLRRLQTAELGGDADHVLARFPPRPADPPDPWRGHAGCGSRGAATGAATRAACGRGVPAAAGDGVSRLRHLSRDGRCTVRQFPHGLARERGGSLFR